MAVNRFFKPSRGEYQSQFVPEELPAGLMLEVLGRKQQGFDKQAANLIALGEWNQRALPGYDTEYVKQKKKDIEGFINKAYEQDISSPESMRSYMKFIKDFKEDQGLSKVASAVATHDAFLKRQEELRTSKDPAEYQRGLENEYLTRLNEYTKEGGYGFTGDILLSTPDTLGGVDAIAEAKKLYDDIRASGSENARHLQDGIYYKDGWKGVSGKVLDNRTQEMLNAFTSSRAGEELIEDYNMRLFGTQVPSVQIQKMNPEERKQYEEGKMNNIYDFLKRASGEFKYGETTTNIDTARNKLADWGREDLEKYPQQPNIEVKGFTTGYQMPNFEQTFGEEGKNNGMIHQNQKIMDTEIQNLAAYNHILQSLQGKQNINDLSKQDLAVVQNIPGVSKLIQGQPLTQAERNLVTNTLNTYIDESNIKLNESVRLNSEIKEKLANATLAASYVVNGGKTKLYEGKNIKEVHDDYDKLSQNSNFNFYYKNIYDGFMSNGNIEGAREFVNNSIKTLRQQAKDKSYKGSAKDNLDALNGLITLKNYTESQEDLNKILDNPEKLQVYKEAFNRTNEYVPTASTKPLEKHYLGFDAQGNKTGKTLNSDHVIENLVKKDPTAFVLYDQDTQKIISPTMIDPATNQVIPNPEYPKGDWLTMVSSDKELLNDFTKGQKTGTKAQFNFTAEIPNISAVQDPSKAEGELMKVKNTQTKRYKVVANGLTTKGYTEAKAKEAWSNVMTDPSVTKSEGRVNIDYNKLTESGKQSYKDYMMYSNPEKAKNLAKVNNSKSGEETYVPLSMYNIRTQQPDQYEIKTTKTSDGGYDVEIYNSFGEKESPTHKVKDIVDLNNYLESLETLTRQQVEESKRLGITPDPKDLGDYLLKKVQYNK